MNNTKKTLLITGGNGFLGRNLAKRLKNKYNVILGSRNNKNNWVAHGETGCEFCPLDVSNIESVRDCIQKYKPEVIIHAAATKFVDLSEKFPLETIDVNVVGSENIARVAIEHGVEFVIGISTDKAAPPVSNIYGMSKAIMERTFCLLNGKTKFCSVRYGNVCWSTGSALPVWSKMILSAKTIASTGYYMRRFLFTVDDAVDLVEAALNNKSIVAGKIVAKKMKSAQISDLLDVFCRENSCTWEKSTPRPGERVDEVLVSKSELEFSELVKIDNQEYILISPNVFSSNPVEQELNSQNAERLSEEELLKIVKSNIR